MISRGYSMAQKKKLQVFMSTLLKLLLLVYVFDGVIVIMA